MLEFLKECFEIYTDYEFWYLVLADLMALGIMWLIICIVSIIEKLKKKYKENKNKENK